MRKLAALLTIAAATLAGPGEASAQQGDDGQVSDPRADLAAGWMDAGVAASNLELVGSVPRPEGFYNPRSLGDILYANSDLAFRGEHVFVGSFRGFNVYDVTDPANPTLRTSVVCPGGQGDVSVHGDLLFMSVEMPNGRVDCGTQGVAQPASPERFLGVRIFDISDLDRPVQIAGVQTCRGSHTHTLVSDPEDDANIYVYVAGTSVVRPAEELAGCSGARPEEDPNTALFRIEVIRVPLAAPGEAAIVSTPRLFADAETGAIEGLWPGGDHGPDTQRTAATDQCHDITAYQELGIAAGACSGNGILIDLSDPANPVRTAEVADPNFAYWHSATFNNDATKVIFTDEWGGGTAARCQASDPETWGANAIFELSDEGELRLASYYKLPVPQGATENCVAHNGSLIPVPGRDIMVQAWYQGGISVFDFTDADRPFEIAYFDRGPLSGSELLLGGHWSAYWYDGHIYGSEIARGLDVLRLTPSEHISRNEIEAAKLARVDVLNPQQQERWGWSASVVVARAYLDQLVRGGGIDGERLVMIAAALDRVDAAARGADGVMASESRERLAAGAALLEADAHGAAEGGRDLDARRLRALAATLRELSRTSL